MKFADDPRWNPLYTVVTSQLWWQGNPHDYRRNGVSFRRDLLECGHVIEARSNSRAKRRRCFQCGDVIRRNWVAKPARSQTEGWIEVIKATAAKGR